MAKRSGIATTLAVVLVLAGYVMSGCGIDPVGTGPGGTDPGTDPGGTTAGSVPGDPALDGRVALRIATQVGDQCPHIPVTPDPRCDPQARPNTAFEIRTTDGDLVTTGRTGADGQLTVYVPPGTYLVRGVPVPEWIITPERQVTASGTEMIPVPLTYTNGIQ